MKKEEVTCVLRHAYGTAACSAAKLTQSVLRNAYVVTAGASIECVTRSLLQNVYQTVSYNAMSGDGYIYHDEDSRFKNAMSDASCTTYDDDAWSDDDLSEWLVSLAQECDPVHEYAWHPYLFEYEYDYDWDEDNWENLLKASTDSFRPSARRNRFPEARQHTQLHVCKKKAQLRFPKLQYAARRKEKFFRTTE